jgi:hypothetical protein
MCVTTRILARLGESPCSRPSSPYKLSWKAPYSAAAARVGRTRMCHSRALLCSSSVTALACLTVHVSRWTLKTLCSMCRPLLPPPCPRLMANRHSLAERSASFRPLRPRRPPSKSARYIIVRAHLLTLTLLPTDLLSSQGPRHRTACCLRRLCQQKTGG